MFDFRLKVFHTVALRLNFTRAAEELFITQPAVTKHIHEIEAAYQTKLFERNGTKIKLTATGELLFKHTEELFKIYRDIDLDLSAVSENLKGTLRLGASTTVAQYVLPAHLAAYKQKFPEVNIELVTHNTEQIERLLADNKIDLGIIEGQSRRQHLKYTAFLEDEMVLCTSMHNRSVKKRRISLKRPA
ncbi:LysR family transcriptional regulator [Chitinophaga sedimenti]|uniref:LysR family transcriptional regulator n=1 Tax=Chitinophaga sedimenti TaxID=2033606 RepID=UPI00249D9A1A|nr:LysR family transcriptional regulator [Chitinophaga sedimenti]